MTRFNEKLKQYDEATLDVDKVVKNHFSNVPKLADGEWKVHFIDLADGKRLRPPGTTNNYVNAHGLKENAATTPLNISLFILPFKKWIESREELQKAYDSLTDDEKLSVEKLNLQDKITLVHLANGRIKNLIDKAQRVLPN